ncbi:MAG: hypothetical protein GC134_04750 [Proteobacteria bacterium]|nr:hypothetical protein [Pseudomonadota bacterium]
MTLITAPVRLVRGTYLRVQLTRGALTVKDLSMDDILAADVAWVLEFMEVGNTKRDKTGAIIDAEHVCPPEARRLARHLAKLMRYFMPDLNTAERAALMAADGSPQSDLNRLISERMFRRELDDAQMYAALAQGTCKGKYPLVATYKLMVATLESADAGRIGSFAPDFLRDGTKKDAIIARANRHVAWCIKNVDSLGDEKPADVRTLPRQEGASESA